LKRAQSSPRKKGETDAAGHKTTVETTATVKTSELSGRNGLSELMVRVNALQRRAVKTLNKSDLALEIANASEINTQMLHSM